ncbi:MAG: peptidoglycan DD-metalloendopeptidase family protein [Sphaerospermopsis kisseleviana]
MHDGIDYGAPAGTPIIAPLPGRVSRVAYQEGGAGHYVTIETIDKAGKKIEQTFMHLITRALVGVGESVKQGDLIGRVGSTGRSSGPHLHWGTRINGRSINPAEFIKMRFMLPSGDGKPSDYLRKADEEGVKAVEDAAKAVEDARKKAEEARQKEIETIKTRIAREGEDDRFRYSQRMGASLQEMKLEAIKAEGEADKQAAEDRVAEFELQIQTSLKAMELDNQLQQVEAEINILQKDRGKLTEQEIKRLDELLYQSTKIKREEQANNQEKKKALAIRKAQAEAERKLKLAEFREGLPRFDESVQSINLTPAQSSVAGTIRPFNDLLNELLQQITTAKDLGDTESIAKLETLTQQVEQARQKALGTQAQQILHQTKLNELTGDELAIYQELTALQEEFDARRQTIQALLSEARQSGYQQEVAMLEDLLNRTDQLERKQIQQVKDRFNILKQSFETVKDGMKSALETFFGDMFTGFNNLGGLINNLFSSILKSIAQVAAQNVARIIFKSIGFGFADGGYVSGPGTSRSDSIMARLSNGEFVMSADSVKYWGTGFLNDINTMRSPQLAFNTAGSSSNSVSRSPKIVMNISTPDANSFRRSEAQVGRDAGEQLRRSAQRNG